MPARPAPPVIDGARLRLRPIGEPDLEARLAMGRDAEFVRMNGGDPRRARAFTASDAERWYRAFPGSLRWAMEHEHRLIGEVRLDPLDADFRHARFAIGIFEAAERDRGLGTEATRLVLRHAFTVLEMDEVMLRVLALNARAIRCYEKCGFVRSGVDRERAYIDGRWQDDVRMRITADRYRAAGGDGGAA